MARHIFILCALLCHACIVRAADRPNIVFILADDLGWSDTTLFGTTKYYRTPNLERLANRGVLFSRAYSASPLCSPTRASILTGQNPARTGITAPVCHLPQAKLTASVRPSAPANSKSLICDSATRLTTNAVTLAERLKSAGYATGHFGKWHLGPEPFSPLQQGFDVDVPHWAGPGPAGSYVAPWKFKDFDADPGEPNQHIEDRMAKEAVKFMEQHKSGPFFLNYWMFSVHAPFDAKKALIEKYRSRANPADPQHSPTYAAMVESMDDAVGTLLDALDRLGIADHTVVIFYSDNGGNMYSEIDGTVPTSNAPLRGGKATMWEGGIRVPAIVKWPGLTHAGTRSPAMIQSTDFYPTILHLLGLPPTPDHPLDGLDIAAAFRGEALDRGPMFTYFPHQTKVPDFLPPSVSVHRGDWKLIRLFHQGDNGAHAYHLYNLKNDIGERTNLAAKEPAHVKELDALIDQFLIDTHAVVPGPNPAYDTNSRPAPADGSTPKAKPKGKAAKTVANGDNPALQGWKARDCTAAVKNGVAVIQGMGNSAFLGFAAGKHGGASVVKMRVRSAIDGSAKVEWLPGGVQTKEPPSVPYSMHGGEWQEVTVNLPATGRLGILRVYLPSQKLPVEIDWIEITSADNATPTRTAF